MEHLEKVEDLENRIKEIIFKEVIPGDPYVGLDEESVDDACDEIIDLLRNKFMVFFK